MKAVVMQGDKKAALVSDRPEPKLRPDYMLVRTQAVALNPTDWKHIDNLNKPGHLIGCDYAGVVEELGSNLTKDFKVGDRICGFVHGGNSGQAEDGAFAEKIVAKSGCQMHIPASWTFEDAATMGVAIMTCGQGLYQALGLNWPTDPTTSGAFVLVYGGSSAMGTMGIQLAKLSGYRVITTCSPHNFDLVKSYGAEAAFNYRDADAASQIKSYTDNKLNVIWDTIALPSSAAFCAQILAPNGSYGTILNTPLPDRPDAKFTYTLGYTSVGEPFSKGTRVYDAEVTARDYKWIAPWMGVGEKLMAEGKVRPHPKRVGRGLEGVLEGTGLMRNDKVSGQKLVFVVG